MQTRVPTSISWSQRWIGRYWYSPNTPQSGRWSPLYVTQNKHVMASKASRSVTEVILVHGGAVVSPKLIRGPGKVLLKFVVYFANDILHQRYCKGGITAFKNTALRHVEKRDWCGSEWVMRSRSRFQVEFDFQARVGAGDGVAEIRLTPQHRLQPHFTFKGRVPPSWHIMVFTFFYNSNPFTIFPCAPFSDVQALGHEFPNLYFSAIVNDLHLYFVFWSYYQ